MQPSFIVVQSWQYAFAQVTGSFSGQLLSPLFMDVNNLFASAEPAAPGGISPNNQAKPCLGSINDGATVTGFISGNQLQVTVQGSAGGVTQGPSCLTEFQFRVQISATAKATGQPFPATGEAVAVQNGRHVSDALLLP